MPDSKKDVLVISDGGKYEMVKKSVSWLSPKNYYLGEFDYIIIDTTVINEEILKKILEKNKTIMDEIKEEIQDTLLNGQSIIFCITSPNIFSATRIVRPNGQQKPEIHNYDWSPIIPFFKKAQGEKFLERPEDYYYNYFKHLNRWTHFFESWSPNFETENKDYTIGVKSEPLLRNTNKKSISFKLFWGKIIKEREGYSGYSTKEKDVTRPIIFIPPINENNNGIKVLLNEIFGDSIETPKRNPGWKKLLVLEGEKNLTKNRDEIESVLEAKIEEFKKMSSDLEELIIYKDLLTENGINLENILEKALDFLGLKVKKVPGYKEDREYEIDGYSIPIEIRGKENKPMAFKDLKQLISRKPEKEAGEYVDGIFFFNHFLDLPPDKRPPAFSKEIIEEALKWKLSLVTTYDIFCLTNKKLKGESTESDINNILRNPGFFEIES